MIVSKKRSLTALAATAVLALGLYGCGGGGGGIKPGDGDGMMPGDGDGMMPGDGDGMMPGDGDGMMPGDGDGMMPGDGDGMMPSDPPSPEAVARAIDLVASWATEDADGEIISGWWWRENNDSGNQEHLSRTHKFGSHASPVISHDANGQLQFNVAIVLNSFVDPLQTNPWAQAHRYANTYEIGESLQGVTTTRSSVTDPNSNAGWQVEELTNDYANGASLSIYVATDAQTADGATDQFETGNDVDENIVLDGIPAIPPGRDFVAVWIGSDEQIDGSLGSRAGSFGCNNSDGCLFFDDHSPGTYYAVSPNVTFTPDGGTAESVTPFIPGSTTPADYLAFGHWLYVPDDVTDISAYDFGVFASGGDPFEAVNLAGLTGTASYEGNAAGMYYVNTPSGSSPANGRFTANVELTAAFGDGTETGVVTGSISNFDWPTEVASSLPATVTLTSNAYSSTTGGHGHDYMPDADGIVRDESNIFDTPWRDNPDAWLGGHVLGLTEADVGGTSWSGIWNGAFFGDGDSPTDHPTSIAGTFMATDYQTGGLTGGFGAHNTQQ